MKPRWQAWVVWACFWALLATSIPSFEPPFGWLLAVRIVAVAVSGYFLFLDNNWREPRA